MRLTWLADVLRDAGCRVDELPGWRTSGGTLSEVRGIVWHHTASGRSTSDATMAAILRNGRPDLPGPLSQLGLTRDGTFVVIASGKSNHNGYGTWGNQSIGIEAYNNGIGETWPAAQIAAWDRGTAAILRHLKLNTSHVKAHRETDPGRKIDPAGVNMDQARQRIAYLLTYQPPSKGPLMALTDAEQAELLKKVRELHADYAVKGRSMRQVILENAERLKRLVSAS
jgi:hypothetical protein